MASPTAYRGGDLSRAVVPIAFGIGAVLFYLFVLRGQSDTPSFNILAVTTAGIVYFLSLGDLRVGIAIMIALIGFSPEMEIGGVGNLRLEDFLIPVLLVAWLTRAAEQREAFADTPLNGPILALLLVGAVSSLRGIAFELTEARRCFFYFGKMIEYYIIYFMITNNIRSRQDAAIFIVTSLGVSSIVGILGFREIMGSSTGSVRIYGPEGEGSNILAGYLILHMFVAIGVILEVKSLRGRFLGIVAAFLMFVPFLYTLSRTGYVAILIGLVVAGFLRERRLLVLLFATLFLLPLLIQSDIVDRASTIVEIFGDRPPSSWTARVYAWQHLGASVFQYPIFGKGVGAVAMAQVDNEYVRQMIDTGLLGLICFLWMLVRILRLGFDVNNLTRGDDLLSAFAIGYLGGSIALMAHAIGATAFMTTRTMEPFMLFTGIAAAIQRLNLAEKKEAETPARRPGELRPRRPHPPHRRAGSPLLPHRPRPARTR